MDSVKTYVAEVHQLYQQMNSECEKVERAHAIGEFAPGQPVINLAQRVISSIDELMPAIDKLVPSIQTKRKQHRLSTWKDDAEAIYSFFSPIKLSQYPPETLARMREKFLYAMGVIQV